MKSLKICLVILCLLPVRAVGTPQFSGANLFMKTIFIKSPKYGLKEVLVDDEDFDNLINYTWCVSKSSSTDRFYVHTQSLFKKRIKKIQMHRLLTNAQAGFMVDHANQNSLDNRKINLRIATPSQNQCNRKRQSNNKMGFKGVYKRKGETRTKKYVSVIYYENKRTVIGHFKTTTEAALAYNNAALRLHGKFAKLNHIPSENQTQYTEQRISVQS